MQFVHAKCLQKWIAISSRLSCEICMSFYQGRKMCKYGVLTSLIPYIKARWHRPKINFSLLFLFHLAEHVFLEAKDFYYGHQNYKPNTFRCRLLISILLRWLDYLLLPRTFVLMVMAFRDWLAWRRTQVIFVPDHC